MTQSGKDPSRYRRKKKRGEKVGLFKIKKKDVNGKSCVFFKNTQKREVNIFFTTFEQMSSVGSRGWHT